MQIINSQTINRFLAILKERKVENHALSISQDGVVLLEKAFEPYTVKMIHPVYSVTKSFTSIAIGFLEQEGLLKLEDKWLSFFPEYQDDVADRRFNDVSIRTLLTMTLGQDLEVELTAQDDWVKAVIGKELANEPNKVFCYNSHCSHLLSALVTKLTGLKTVDYLTPRLFVPLGFKDYYWQADKKGRSIGGYGLHLRIEDLRKFGECLLNCGIYHGKQVIPEAWVAKATSYQVATANVYPSARQENRQGYGLHFWLCSHGGYRCAGLHGQICFIQPANKLVVAMFNNTTGSQTVLSCLFDALTEQRDDAAICDFKSATLPGDKNSQVLNDWLGLKTVAYDNCFALESLQLVKKADDLLEINIRRHNQNFSLLAKYNNWYPQENHFHAFNKFWTSDAMDIEQPTNVNNTLFACYAWETKTTLAVMVRELDHSAVTSLKFAFDRYHIEMYYSVSGLYTTLNDTKCTFIKTK